MMPDNWIIIDEAAEWPESKWERAMDLLPRPLISCPACHGTGAVWKEGE